MSMNTDVLAQLVLTLYAAGAVLVVLSIAVGRLQVRREALRRQAVMRLRGPFEAYVLTGEQMTAEYSHKALLDLALRYADVIRGTEADRIVELLESEGIVDKLLRDLGSRKAWRRAAAADCLGRLRLQRAVPALIEAINDPSEDVRTVAARSLALIGDASAIPSLARALRDPSRWSLSLIAENLMTIGPGVVSPLLELLDDDDHNVRVAVVRVLGEIRDPRATPALVGILLKDENLNLRAQAALALGKLSGEAAESALLVAIRDEHWEVRSQAAKALGRLGNPSLAPAIAAAMPDSSWWVRLNSAESLARLGEQGRDQLAQLTGHADPYVREQAAAMLEIYGLRTGELRPGPASAGSPPVTVPA